MSAKPRSLPRILLDRHGRLAQELVRAPGGFGLGQQPASRQADATTTAICGFCSTGCGLSLHLKDGEAVGITPATDYPVNLGMACPKGWEALAPLESDDRATTPMVRRGGKLVRTSWEEALELFVDRFKGIQAKHGAESVAFLSTGQIVTEEMALLGALTKFGMGLMHGDGNTRQCMATAVVAYKQCFGFDAPPYTYADFEQSDTIVFVCRNPHDPTIVVLDPRRTETAQRATMHLPLAPKSDLTLLYAVAHVLIREGWIDDAFIRTHTDEFGAFAEHVAAFTPERAAEASGLDAEEIVGLARTIRDGKRVSFWWTMGVNQSHEGVLVAQAIIALALITGNIGRPGTGANSITGQCNAMGSRLFSNTTNLLGGHGWDDPGARAKVTGALGIDDARIPRANGKAYDQIMKGILDGEIRGLWVIATNAAHSWINQNDARDVLDKLDFLVVQDMYANTETAERADLILPAAGWGEKEGTFINSERRIGLVKQVRRAPGEALSDFRIFKLVAEVWGVADVVERFRDPEATFRCLAELSAGQPCDFSGIRGYRMLHEHNGIQWPFPKGADADSGHERRLFEDGTFYTESGRARFRFGDTRPVPEPVNEAYPITLLTGRGSSAQWHTQTRTRQSGVLRNLHSPDPYIELSPADARDRGITSGDWVLVRSRRGSARARAFVTPTVRGAQAFMPMHVAETNRLTLAAFDPSSRQPAYKACAIQVDREA